MSPEQTDLQKRLANLLRVGTVHSINHTTARVRVAFGENISDWVPWMASRAGVTREWNPPAVGEQVALFNPCGEPNAGFVLPGGIYRQAAPANGTDAGKVTLNLPDGGEWSLYVGNAHIKSKNSEIKITVGSTHMTMTHSGVTIHGDVEVQGKITASGLVKGGNVTLQTHVHSGVQSGGSNTGVPV